MDNDQEFLRYTIGKFNQSPEDLWMADDQGVINRLSNGSDTFYQQRSPSLTRRPPSPSLSSAFAVLREGETAAGTWKASVFSVDSIPGSSPSVVFLSRVQSKRRSPRAFPPPTYAMACPAGRQIPDHLLVEILSRLPAKSLFRSKCVSKSWLSLTSDPHYRKKLPSPMSGLFFNSTPVSADPNASLVSARYVDLSVDDTPISASFDFLPIHQSVEILDCCNGLLLCRSWEGSSANLKHYYVCNPATRKWTALPNRPQKFRFVALAFDPGLSRHFLVVHFKKLGSSTELEVFSSKTGEWVECQLSKGNGTLRRFLYRPTVFFNGVVYILAGFNNVVQLDLELKVCRKIILPESFGFGCLGHSGGYLCYAGCHHELHVWVLKDQNKNEWELKHHVDIDAMLKERYAGEVLRYYRVVAFHPHIDVVYLRMRGKLLSYNLNSARLEEVCNTINGMLHYFAYSPFLLDDDS